MSADPHNLQRFIDAQRPIYGQVREELQGGRKEGHWMWFIFPQLKGLGTSPTARKYALAGEDEARALLDHSLLGLRLRECTQLVNAISNRSLQEIFGHPDHLKFHSCITLFAHVSQAEEAFSTALKKFFHGRSDRKTIELL